MHTHTHTQPPTNTSSCIPLPVQITFFLLLHLLWSLPPYAMPCALTLQCIHRFARMLYELITCHVPMVIITRDIIFQKETEWDMLAGEREREKKPRNILLSSSLSSSLSLCVIQNDTYTIQFHCFYAFDFVSYVVLSHLHRLHCTAMSFIWRNLKDIQICEEYISHVERHSCCLFWSIFKRRQRNYIDNYNNHHRNITTPLPNNATKSRFRHNK